MYEVLKSVISAGGYKLADIQHKVKKLYVIGDLTEAQMDELLERTFEGSMPAFIAAFAKRQKLSDEEIKKLQDMIDSY